MFQMQVLDHIVIQRMDTSGRTLLGTEGAAGAAAGAKMFSKDELSQILR
jgi:chromodomain-helicase-DNA-binding protein 1